MRIKRNQVNLGMAMLPISVTVPSWLSKEQLIGATGCAGGLIFSDYMAASVISRMGLTGTTALVGSAAAKGALGIITFYGAGKMRGGSATALGLASIGCFASIAIDVIRYVWPGSETPSARLRSAVRGARLAAPAVRVGPIGAPAGIRLRAETPSGIALGGF